MFVRPAVIWRACALVTLLVLVVIGGTAVYLARSRMLPPIIHVRWKPDVSFRDRVFTEDRYGLEYRWPHEGTTLVYELADASAANIQALIADPQVEDTEHIDRANLEVTADSRRPEQQPALAYSTQLLADSLRFWLPASLTVRDDGRSRDTAAAPLPAAAAEAANATEDDPDEDRAAVPRLERSLTITSADGATLEREQLISFLWGGDGSPRSLPSVRASLSDRRFSQMQGLDHIERLRVPMEFDLLAQSYHFVPVTPRGRLVLFHGGHGDDFVNNQSLIGRFLSAGFDVAAFNMLLSGDTPRPDAELPRRGRVQLRTHDELGQLRPPTGHPAKYFVEPVIVALNDLTQRYRFDRIAMVGISGGGWVTTLAAAVDPRITDSFPVAGTYPLAIRTDRDRGDWEQWAPELYRQTSYLNLYLLGSLGPGRQQLQILNTYDPCCFAGDRWRTYRELVRSRVAAVGPGGFDVFGDATHREHAISPTATDLILADLQRP